MLKYTILFGVIFYMVQSQRPWHAGSGNRLPQVLPQYIDERIAGEQAGQAAQGNQIAASQAAQGIPVGQETQGIPVSQGAQEIPVSQNSQGFSIGQGTQDIPVRQGTQGIPVCQCPQGTLIYQGVQGIPTYQGTQGNPMTQGVQGTQTNGISGTLLPIGNRIDSGDGSFAAAPPLSTTMNPADLPIDAHGDIDLVNRIKTWPRDKQPFWYINWQAIQAHRGDVNNTAQPAQTQPNTRSFFAG